MTVKLIYETEGLQLCSTDPNTRGEIVTEFTKKKANKVFQYDPPIIICEHSGSCACASVIESLLLCEFAHNWLDKYCVIHIHYRQ